MQTGPIEQISAEFAHHLWQGAGQVLGHGALLYGASKAIDVTQRNPKPNFFSRFNPFTNFKKMTAWLGFEAGMHAVQQPLSKIWNDAAPISEKLLSPIVKSLIRRPLEHLQESGYIALRDPNDHSGWAPTEIALRVNDGMKGIFSRAPAPNGAYDQTYYAIAEREAPRVGRFIADGIETTFDYTSKIAQFPGNLVQGIADATGLSYPAALALTVAMGGLAYLGLRSAWSNYMHVDVKVDTKVDATNTATQHQSVGVGGIHFHVSNPSAMPTPVATNHATAIMPPVTIVPGDEESKLAVKA